jgi:hypothetical protein
MAIQEIDLGKIQPQWRGEFSPTPATNYEPLDTLSYLDTVYICILEADGSQLPTNTTYFKPLINLTGFVSSSDVLLLKSDSSIPMFTTDGTTVTTSQEVVIKGARVLSGASVTLPSLSIGTDYKVFFNTVTESLTAQDWGTPDPAFSFFVGGFHNQNSVINEYSLYDANYKPNVRDPRGMVRSPLGIWADIYLLNTDPVLNGTSAYNVTIADGSSPPKVPVVWGGDGTAAYDDFTQYTAARVLAAYGKRLPSSQEFEQLAFGSVTGYGVVADPVTTKFDASAKSMIGCEQVSGHMWQWGAERWDRGNGSSGYAWYAADTNGEGQVFTVGSGVGASRFGASWIVSIYAGSRASAWISEPWYSDSDIAARGVCDHFES